MPQWSYRSPNRSESSLVIHNVVVSGHRTSVRLEPMMWDALREIARNQRRSVHEIVTEIDHGRTASTLTAAIRVFIVAYYRSAAQERWQAPQPLIRAAPHVPM